MLSAPEAERTAEYELRFGEIGGNLPHLSDPRYSEAEQAYVFLIKISYPRLPDDDDGEMSFDRAETIGEIIVDSETEDVTHTPRDVIEARIRDIKERDEDERWTR